MGFILGDWGVTGDRLETRASFLGFERKASRHCLGLALYDYSYSPFATLLHPLVFFWRERVLHVDYWYLLRLGHLHSAGLGCGLHLVYGNGVVWIEIGFERISLG